MEVLHKHETGVQKEEAIRHSGRDFAEFHASEIIRKLENIGDDHGEVMLCNLRVLSVCCASCAAMKEWKRREEEVQSQKQIKKESETAMLDTWQQEVEMISGQEEFIRIEMAKEIERIEREQIQLAREKKWRDKMRLAMQRREQAKRTKMRKKERERRVQEELRQRRLKIRTEQALLDDWHREMASLLEYDELLQCEYERVSKRRRIKFRMHSCCRHHHITS